MEKDFLNNNNASNMGDDVKSILKNFTAKMSNLEGVDGKAVRNQSNVIDETIKGSATGYVLFDANVSNNDNPGSSNHPKAACEGIGREQFQNKYYASFLNNDNMKKRINFRYVTNEEKVNKADVTIPLDSVDEVKSRFANTLFGYFLGKRLAFPIVENYVKNTWAKYGITKVMLHDGFFFFKFSSSTGMEQVLENGPWFIRTIPLILNPWTTTTILKKEEITRIPVWVKLHKVPLVAYTEIGLSLIGSKIGRPIILDAYTSNMCLDLWGRNTFARALIEVSSHQALMDSLVVAIPLVDEPGHSLVTIDVEYEWQPPNCVSCKYFGHSNELCPNRCQVVKEVSQNSEFNEGGNADGFEEVRNRKNKGKNVAGVATHKIFIRQNDYFAL